MSEPPLPDDYLREIGRVAVEWSKTETIVETAIWSLLFVDTTTMSPFQYEQEGRAITTHVNLLLRVDMMLSVANTVFRSGIDGQSREWWSGLYLTEIADFAAKVRATYPKRNKIVHGLWQVVGDKTALRLTYRARGEVTPFFDFLTADDIAAVAKEIADLNSEFDWLTTPLFAEAIVWQRSAFDHTTRPSGDLPLPRGIPSLVLLNCHPDHLGRYLSRAGLSRFGYINHVVHSSI